VSDTPVRVLIVDDQETFRSAARLVVELANGFEIIGEAPTGEEGVRMAAELNPDLVLMDVNLPGIDGLEATRQIVPTGVRVVVLSTYEAADYDGRAREAGASAFISKSDFGPDTLRAAWSDG
jgi:DNA-binding NarL/FixJ family response regulator